MGNKFGFQAVGDREKIERLPEEVQKALTDFEELYEEAVFPHMRHHASQVYATQGKAAGTRWADYSGEPKYAAFKAAVLGFDGPDDLPTNTNTSGGLLRWKAFEFSDDGEGGQTRTDTERLYPSLTEKDHEYRIEDIDGKSAAYGTSLPYAERLAQEGGQGPFGESYPPRPILSMTDRGKQKLRVQIATHYCQKLKALGLGIQCDTDTIMRFAGLG